MLKSVKDSIRHIFPNLIDYVALCKNKRAIYNKVQEIKLLDESQYPLYLKQFYEFKTGHSLNIKNPMRFTEKVQWRKLNDRDEIYSLLSDKYRVRKWVEKKIGYEYLVPLIGHWSKFDDIDFGLLPDQFVLKTNNGCHANIIVKNKKAFLRSKWVAKQKMNYWLNSLSFYEGLELHYGKIQPEIIAEKYIEPADSEDCLVDYKFHCFDGEPFVCQVIRGRTTKETIDFYDMNWTHLSLAHLVYPNTQGNIEKPRNYELMKRIAMKLSKGFQYVRVDLYSTDKVYFGEMTFTPANGTERYIPDEWDFQMGEKWDITVKQINRSVVMDQ